MPYIADITKHLKGIDFPANKQQIIDKARSNNAPKEAIDELKKIPDKQYQTMPELWDALGKYEPEEGEKIPYQSNADLPLLVKDELPDHAQDIFRAAFNRAWDEYANPEKRRGHESRKEVAYKVAWSAVETKYTKKDGKWVPKGQAA